MRLVKVLIVFCTLSFLSSQVYPQYLESEPTAVQRIFYGGNIGLSFGTVTYISVNPLVGYRLTNRISAGVGINYTFAKSNYYNYRGNMYGGNVFASFVIVKNLGEVLSFYQGSGILIYAEYNLMNVSNYYDFPGTSIKYIASPMAGVAFQSPIGTRSYMLIMLLFNFNESSISPYPNPIIKASLQF